MKIQNNKSTATETGDLVYELSELRNRCTGLELVLSKLNFFRAMGAERAELRHSDFLSFLLSPTASHGLGDAFLRAWLQICLTKAEASTELKEGAKRLLGLIERSDLKDTQIFRERPARIDIFILNETHEFAVIIENKIDHSEGERQLSDYWKEINKQHPKFERFGLYLSPYGSKPQTHRSFCPIAYDTVYGALDRISRCGLVKSGSEIELILKHYRELIEEEFMGNSDASDLAWEIDRDFPKTLNFLQKRTQKIQIREKILELVQDASTHGLIALDWGGYYVNFIPSEWKQSALLVNPDGNPTGWVFWFNFDSGVTIWLGANRNLKAAMERLLQLATRRTDLFPIRSNNDGWPTVWCRPIFSALQLGKVNRREALERIEQEWEEFLDELSAIRAACAVELSH